MLEKIRDRRIRRKLLDRMASLAEAPEKRGKPLRDELSGLRSLRAVGQRYRILYRLEDDLVVVLVLAVGIRKEGSKRDVYELAEKLARRGKLKPED